MSSRKSKCGRRIKEFSLERKKKKSHENICLLYAGHLREKMTLDNRNKIKISLTIPSSECCFPRQCSIVFSCCIYINYSMSKYGTIPLEHYLKQYETYLPFG